MGNWQSQVSGSADFCPSSTFISCAFLQRLSVKLKLTSATILTTDVSQMFSELIWAVHQAMPRVRSELRRHHRIKKHFPRRVADCAMAHLRQQSDVRKSTCSMCFLSLRSFLTAINARQRAAILLAVRQIRTLSLGKGLLTCLNPRSPKPHNAAQPDGNVTSSSASTT